MRPSKRGGALVVALLFAACGSDPDEPTQEPAECETGPGCASGAGGTASGAGNLPEGGAPTSSGGPNQGGAAGIAGGHGGTGGIGIGGTGMPDQGGANEGGNSAANAGAAGGGASNAGAASSSSGAPSCSLGAAGCDDGPLTCEPDFANCDDAKDCETVLSSPATCGESCEDVAECDALSAATCVNGGCNSPWAAWPMPNGAVDVQQGAPNPTSYTNNGDGTVLDKVTGLIWQQAVAADRKYDLDGATKHCSALSLAGHKDWRVPTLIELISVMDHTAVPTIDSTFFPLAPAGVFWSSTPFDGFSGMAADFYYGDAAYMSRTSAAFVRCVR